MRICIKCKDFKRGLRCKNLLSIPIEEGSHICKPECGIDLIENMYVLTNYNHDVLYCNGDCGYKEIIPPKPIILLDF